MSEADNQKSPEIKKAKPNLIDKLRGRERWVNAGLALTGTVLGTGALFLDVPSEIKTGIIGATMGWATTHSLNALGFPKDGVLACQAVYYTASNAIVYYGNHNIHSFDSLIGIGAAGLANELIYKYLKK